MPTERSWIDRMLRSLHLRRDAMPKARRERVQSPGRIAFERLLSSKTTMGAFAILSSMIVIAVAAPLLAPYSPIEMVPGASLAPPGGQFILGGDLVGRDVLSRLIYGGRLSLMVGVISMVVSASVGILLGLVAGFFGGKVDTVIMRLIDMLLAFPGILLALTVVSFLGPGLFNVMIAVGISGIPNFARLVRGSVLSAKENVYVEAARCVGCENWRIMTRHLLPNVVAPITVMASLTYGWAILNAASLSFLGLGAQPPTAEWGVMLSEGRTFLRDAPWMTVFPGAAIMLSVLTANLLGDGLRDALDPHLRL